MSTPTVAAQDPQPAREPTGSSAGHRPRTKLRNSLLSQGQPWVWLNGGALAICLAMIIGLLVLVVYQGMATFWPGPAVAVTTVEGKHYLGEVIRDEEYSPEESVFDNLPAPARVKAEAFVGQHDGRSQRRLLRTGNFDLTQTHHHWVSDFEVATEAKPKWALVIERSTNDGRFYGYPTAFLLDGKEVTREPEEIWAQFNEFHDRVRERVAKREKISKYDIGPLRDETENARVALNEAELDYGKTSPEYAAAEMKVEEVKRWAAKELAGYNAEIAGLNRENNRFQLRMTTADGRQKDLYLGDIVRAYPANQLTFMDKLGIYFSRWGEFLTGEPRNRNSEGGVLPAIWGTAAMTLLMSFAVVPFGVLAALYLREYAKQGPLVSAVRIAVNNLAGVPSIVFGVFGLGFFCYIIGAGLDDLLFNPKAVGGPTFGTGGLLWASITLALLTLPVVIVATEEALAAVPQSMREGSYACGASKWQTIWRIVLPRALPGIMTGTILAMARGAGEVAPLMLVGAAKVAPGLVDGVFPYIHPSRSFMHLGFNIYDLGFQSQDSESAKPMVFTTTLILIVLVATLNLAAMWLRARFRRRFMVSQF
jgi:phosphate transport system permease protein